MKLFTSTAAALVLSAVAAFAGPQYIDSTGYAVSGYDVVAYFDLPQSEIGQAQPAAVAGNKSITADYNGSTFAFSSEANRATFLEDPEKYVPQYDGHCAFGAAQGGKVPGNPHLWRIVDGKLYLNIKDTVVYQWEMDIPGYLQKSEANWVSLEPKDASTSPIPGFTSTAPDS